MNNEEYLQLQCGNPEECGSASFSRFVLPFAYRLEEITDQEQHLVYQRKSTSDSKAQDRKKYLTNETSLVLFERAKWFEVCTDAWQNTPWETEQIIVNLKTHGNFAIKMLPPSLVLFECEFPKTTAQCDTENDLLRTGFLYIDIYFPKQSLTPKLDALLLLNEIFRYFDLPYEEHVDGYKNCLGNIPIEYTNGDYRKVNEPDCDDKSRYFVRWLNLLQIPVKNDGTLYQLIPDAWLEAAKSWIYRSEITPQATDIENCLVYADNRSYVWTAALLEEGGNSLKKAFRSAADEAGQFGHWVKLLNVDAPEQTPELTHTEASAFEKSWAEERTYHRWEARGNWYGFNNHSGVMLAAPTPPHLCRVFREQYFDQTILLLYLRTTLFRFSRKLSWAVHEQQMQQRRDDDKVWLEQIKKLRKAFSRFAILYQFPLLSNQQQAIEMYVLARKHLDIDELYREVQQEIDSTHDFLEQVEARKLGEAANKLASYGIPIAVASVIAALFGMNVYGMSESCTGNCVPLTEIGAQTVFILAVGFLTWQFFRTKH